MADTDDFAGVRILALAAKGLSFFFFIVNVVVLRTRLLVEHASSARSAELNPVMRSKWRIVFNPSIHHDETRTLLQRSAHRWREFQGFNWDTFRNVLGDKPRHGVLRRLGQHSAQSDIGSVIVQEGKLLSLFEKNSHSLSVSVARRRLASILDVNKFGEFLADPIVLSPERYAQPWSLVEMSVRYCKPNASVSRFSGAFSRICRLLVRTVNLNSVARVDRKKNDPQNLVLI